MKKPVLRTRTAALSALPPPSPQDHEVATDLHLIEIVLAHRQAFMDELLGRKLSFSALREALLRQVFLLYTQGKFSPIKDYIAATQQFRSSSTYARTLLLELRDCGAVEFIKTGRDTRETLVMPTPRMIAHFRRYLPAFRADLATLASGSVPENWTV